MNQTIGLLFHIWSGDDGKVFCGEPRPDMILSRDSMYVVHPESFCPLCVAEMIKLDH
jgi:hypothetical protein